MSSRRLHTQLSRPASRRLLPPAACILFAACSGGGAADGGTTPPPSAAVDYRDEIVYQLLTDRFFNGDPGNDSGALDRRGDEVDPSNPVGWHGGDLAGIRRKLEEGYFQRMGFTAIWISPVVIQVPVPGNGGGVNTDQPFAGFHGYWADRFDAIEPHFGNLAAFRALGTAADAAGVKLIVDVVVNHTGLGSSLVAQNPSWFRTGAQCGADDVTLCLGGLPDFRQEVDGVSDFLLGTIRYLRDNASIDGLRMDTMKHVGDAFWTQFFAAGSPADATRLWTVGEVFSSSVPQIAHYLDVVGSPSVLDFPLKFAIVDSLARGGSTRRLGEALAEDVRYRDPTRLATFIDNHDVWRFASEAESVGKSLAEATQRLDLALSLLYMARGTPVVYYGTEIGMRGEGDSYDKPLGASSREDMDFSQLDGSALDERLRALADARRRHPALRRGTQRTLLVPGGGCVPPASSLDPAADFGDTLYLRGSFDGWSSPPLQSQRFANLGGRQYEAAVPLAGGRHEFKVAAADWSPEFASIEQDSVPGVPIKMAAASGAGSNSRIDITTADCYMFALDATSSSNPVLTVSPKGAAGIDPDVFVFARTMTGEKSVIVALNNESSAVDLSTITGGGIDVQGLIADGAVVEITGAVSDLRVSGGRLRGTLPALAAFGVAAP